MSPTSTGVGRIVEGATIKRGGFNSAAAFDIEYSECGHKNPKTKRFACTIPGMSRIQKDSRRDINAAINTTERDYNHNNKKQMVGRGKAEPNACGDYVRLGTASGGL